MVGNRDRRRPHVIAVIRFWQLMTEALGVNIGARFVLLGYEWRVHGNAYDVVSGRNDRLTVATIEHKVLPGECEAIGVGPARCHTLVSGNADATAVPKFSFTRRHSTDGNRIRIRVEHAEPALCRSPDLARARIDELIERVVAEVEVAMARSKLKQTVASSNVHVWIANKDVLISGIRCHDSKTHERPQTGCDFTFDCATSIR